MNLAQYNVDFLKGQFILSKSTFAGRKGWNTYQIKDWTLEVHPALTVTKILRIDRSIGYVLGYGFYKNFPLNGTDITIDNEAIDSVVDFKLFLDNINGRFIGLLVNEDGEFLFPDVACSLSVLYDLENVFFASSTFLFSDTKKRLNKKLVKICEESAQTKGAVFPCGFTYFEKINVLRPNNYIDLRKLKIVTQNKHSYNPNLSFDFVSSSLSSNINNIFKSLSLCHRLELFLTAGKDSRMLLGCSKDLHDQMFFSTYYESRNIEGQLLNCEVAAIISQNLYLNFTLKDVSNNLEKISNNNVSIIGFGGELSRGYLWHYISDNIILNPHLLAKILGYPDCKIILDYLEEWLSHYDKFPPKYILDLIYLEYYMGFLTSPTLYRYDCFSKFAIAPFCTWGNINLFINLDEKSKNGDNFTRRLLNAQYPELNNYPFY